MILMTVRKLTELPEFQKHVEICDFFYYFISFYFFLNSVSIEEFFFFFPFLDVLLGVKGSHGLIFVDSADKAPVEVERVFFSFFLL